MEIFSEWDSELPLAVGIVIGALVIIYFLKGSGGAGSHSKSAKTATARSAPPERSEKMTSKVPKKYTKEEVAKHDKRDDVWIIVDNKVYDVTPYVEEHLGGDAILNYAGGDSTTGFRGEQHPVKVQEILDMYYIGDLA